jgi:hypothetical protein
MSVKVELGTGLICRGVRVNDGDFLETATRNLNYGVVASI